MATTAESARIGRYLTTVTVLGLGASVWAWTQVSSIAVAAAFIALWAAAELLPASIRQNVDATLANVIGLTAILVGGPALGIVAVLGSLVVWRALPRRPYPKTRMRVTLFNFSQQAIAAGLAGLAFVALATPVTGVAEIGRWHTWTALLVAAVINTAVNHGFVALAINLSTGERLSSAVGGFVGITMVLQVFYAALAILAAALWFGAGPWALAFLVVPVLVARQGLLAFQREEEAYDNLVGALLKTIEVKDGYTAGHTDRVAQLCVEVAREFDFNYEQLRAVRYAAKLHDVGKLAVPSSIINKPGRLSDVEFERIKEHPDVGARILEEVDFLAPILDGVLYHHERVDGRGYPRGLRGEEIPLIARIITACDAFDAMTSTRSYREAMEIEDAVAELDRNAGTQFDADVVRVLKDVAARLAWQPTREYTAPERARTP